MARLIRRNLRRPTFGGLRTLWSLTAGSRLGFVVLVGLGLVASFIETLSVSLVVFLLYRAVLGADFPGAQGVLAVFFRLVERVINGNLYGLGAIIAGAVMIRQAFVGAYELVGAHVSNAVHHRLRSDLFRQYLTLSYEFIAQKDYGELTNMLQVEAWRVAVAVQQLSRILINGSAILVYLLVITLISPPLTLAALVAGGAVLGLTQLFRTSLRSLSREATLLHEQLAERMFGAIQAMRTIRAYGVEQAEIERFDRLSRAVARVFIRLSRIDNASRPLLELAGLGAIVTLVCLSYAAGNSATTTVAIVALLFRVQPQVRELQGHWLSLLGVEASLVAVAGALDRAGKSYSPNGTRRAAGLRHQLAFENVGFVHRGATEPSLQGVSFVIPRGTTAALIGPSGAGKSTVVNLLLRLYEPQSGNITVDGVDLADLDRISWLGRVTIAGQDIDLLEGTILDNVRLARPAASIEEVEYALRIAGMLDVVEQVPGGFHANVGERGLRLSGGQRQRIGLARAILGRPDILVLDEATNAIDPMLEMSIHATLRAAFPQLTILIVAHRSSALARADLVIVLKAGRVSSVGTPKQLLEEGERALTALL